MKPGAEELTVRFVGGEASEDVVRAARSFMQGVELPGPLTLTVRWGESTTSIRDVRLRVPDLGEVRAAGPALYPALHKLCEHALSLKAASNEDRLRWRRALDARRDSGMLPAIVLPSDRE